jgi:hypothetical protein
MIQEMAINGTRVKVKEACNKHGLTVVPVRHLLLA